MFAGVYGCIVTDLNCPEVAYIDEEYNNDTSEFERSYIFKTETHLIKVDKYQMDMYVKYYFNVIQCVGVNGVPNTTTESDPNTNSLDVRCQKKCVKEWCKRCYGEPKVESLTCLNLADFPEIYINSIEPI